MLKQRSILCLTLVGGGLTSVLWAQYAPAPTAYTVTMINGMMGTPVTMEIHRDGSRVVIDNTHDGQTTRGLYNLDTHTTQSWDTANPTNGCGSGTFSGDWGDPFSFDAEAQALLKTATAQPGTETINGFTTKAVEATDPKSNFKIKVWREPKYGMIVKGVMTPPGGAAMTIVEVKSFSPAKPDGALFKAPSNCAPPVHVPTAAERFAAETGSNGADFVDPSTAPPSPNSCTMLFRVVRAVTMQPITNFQVALDLKVSLDHPGGYTIGVGDVVGQSTFEGGSLKEVTKQLQNGVLRVDKVPELFDLELAFGKPGTASAMVYRKCSTPQTVLLFVVKNPDKISDGVDWMWVKSGKYATVTGR